MWKFNVWNHHPLNLRGCISCEWGANRLRCFPLESNFNLLCFGNSSQPQAKSFHSPQSIKNWMGPYQQTPKLQPSYEILRFRAPFSGSDSWRFLGFIPSKESKTKFITTEINGTTKFIRNSDHTTTCHEGIFLVPTVQTKKLKPYFRIFRGLLNPDFLKKVEVWTFRAQQSSSWQGTWHQTKVLLKTCCHHQDVVFLRGLNYRDFQNPGSSP